MEKIDCPSCGGKGYGVTIGCCGNYSEHGECKQYCCVPEQQQCEMCGGCGSLGTIDVLPAPPEVG